MTTEVKPRNPGDRGQGRKSLKSGQQTIGVTLKMTTTQREKLARLGGAPWVRDRIDKAKEADS